MSISIELIKITDNLANRSRVCNIALAPESQVSAPAGEFAFPEDMTYLSATDIRPVGAKIAVKATQQGIGDYALFTGAVEFMDDLENPDAYTFTLDMSDTPVDQRHRTKLSKAYNDHATTGDNVDEHTTALTILSDCCASVGINLGRCDLPDYNVYGTYEINRQSILEIAESLCEPFNLFAFQHFYVRVDDRNGLQIIKIDYTKSGTRGHTMANILSRKRSYERYMPDDRLGNPDILLVGKDKYIPNPENDLGEGNYPEYPVEEYAPATLFRELYHTYASSSKDTQVDEDSPSNNEDSYTEKETRVRFTVAFTIASGTKITTYPDGHTTSTYRDLPVAIPDNGADIDDAISALLDTANPVIDVQIEESQTVYESTDTYEANEESGVTLTQHSETIYNYIERSYTTNMWDRQTQKRTLLAFTETSTAIFPDGVELDYTKELTSYNYNKYGVNTSTITRHYDFDAHYDGGSGSWILRNISVKNNDSPEMTNAALGYYRNKPNRWPNQPGSYADENQEQGSDDSLQPKRSRYIIAGQVMLLNGEEIDLYNIENSGNYSDAALDALKMKLARAYTINLPYMDLAGLQKVYALCQREQAVERDNYYWQLVNGTCSFDNSFYGGESGNVDGTAGVVESVEHTITESSALTSINMRRLVKL